MDDKARAFDDLTTAAHRAYRRGLQYGNGGNLSVRFAGAMLVKSAGGAFIDCAADGTGWVAAGFDGTPLPGESEAPTREWRLHAALLAALPEIGGVMHCHAPWSIAWAQAHDEVPLATWQAKLKFGCQVPVLDIPAAVVPEEALPRLAALLAQQPAPPGFLLRGHGLVAVGKTAAEAEHVAEMIEETAKICVLQALLRR